MHLELLSRRIRVWYQQNLPPKHPSQCWPWTGSNAGIWCALRAKGDHHQQMILLLIADPTRRTLWASTEPLRSIAAPYSTFHETKDLSHLTEESNDCGPLDPETPADLPGVQNGRRSRQALSGPLALLVVRCQLIAQRETMGQQQRAP